MSTNWVADVEELLRLQRATSNVLSYSSESSLREFLEFRVQFLREELDETLSAIAEGSAEGVVDGLIDLCVVAIGTLGAFGIDAGRAWDAVHAANSLKTAGVNPRRTNPLGLPDLLKPEGWLPPSHADNIGCLQRVLNGGKV